MEEEEDDEEVEEEYLHSHAVIGHGHAGVAVPAHVQGGVGTVVCLLVQRAPR